MKLATNERVGTEGVQGGTRAALLRRALHVSVPSGGQVVDLIVGESAVGFDGAACSPSPGSTGATIVPLSAVPGHRGSPCRVPGFGPLFALLGTNGADRITGPNNDRLSGGSGRDRLSGGTGADRLRGGGGADKLRGGDGNDRLIGGRGNDGILAGNGRDRVNAGPGNDIVNAATRGAPARINCGRGRDRVRVNGNELRRLRGCEFVDVFRRQRR